MNQFELQEAQTPEMKRLSFYKEQAAKTLSGEHVYASVYDDLKKTLVEAEEAGHDVSGIKAEIEEMIKRLPGAELNNILSKADEFLKNGDISMAKLWQADAERRIRGWEEKGVLTNEELLEFQKRSNDLLSKFY